MPRISLWRENKSKDYKFFDDRVREQLTIGGTGVNVHKYLGSDTGSTPSPTTPVYDEISESNIQDLLFLENRDRKYDPDIYILRGHYNVTDMDFDLSQFGLFLQNDTLFIVFHINDMIDALGRKLMPGDVLELQHLRDFAPLDNNIPVALRKFYVIQDATRAAEGYSPTWWPHLWRVKATPLVNGQEYKDLIDNLEDDDGNPIGDWLTNYDKEIEINNAIVEQAAADVPMAGYDTTPFYTLPTQMDGSVNEYEVPTGDTTVINTDSEMWSADRAVVSPTKSAYDGYLTGDGVPMNGFPVTTGTDFPTSPLEGDFVLRLDYYPNRLFRFNGGKWVKIEDNVRHNYLPEYNKAQIGTFINNEHQFTTGDGQTFVSRQGLSEAIKPKADN